MSLSSTFAVDGTGNLMDGEATRWTLIGCAIFERPATEQNTFTLIVD